MTRRFLRKERLGSIEKEEGGGKGLWPPRSAIMSSLARLYFGALILFSFAIGAEYLLFPHDLRVEAARQFAGVEYAKVQTAAFERLPWLIGLHAFSGCLFCALAALQYQRHFRLRHRFLHRVFGRIFVGNALVLGLSGVAVAYAYPFAGRAGIVPNIISFGAISIFSYVAVRAAQCRDIVRHEAWMTRLAAIGLGIALSRAYTFLLISILHFSAREALAQVFWLGSSTSLLVTELWLRHKSSRDPFRIPVRSLPESGATSSNPVITTEV